MHPICCSPVLLLAWHDKTGIGRQLRTTDYGLRSDVRDYRRSCMTMSGVGAVVEILGGRTVLVVLVVVVAGTDFVALKEAAK
jgi:hypothetical protein